MGSTNKTTNYELSQFVGSDKPSWLGDYNADMGKIDLAIKARAVEAGQAQASADTANGKADALDTRVDTAEDNILALQNASTTDHTQIATNTANISKNAQDIVQLDAKIGHTQITIGDHTVTGAISVLAQGSGDADNISYDNTTSGLTATNVQAAIDEVKADIPTIPSTYDADDIVYNNTASGLTATNVQGAIDEVEATVSSIVQSGGWTLAGTVTGTTAVDLSNITYNELSVEVIGGNDNTAVMICNVPKVALSATAKGYRMGQYASSTSFMAARVNITDESVAIAPGSVYISNTDQTSTSVLNVYYK